MRIRQDFLLFLLAAGMAVGCGSSGGGGGGRAVATYCPLPYSQALPAAVAGANSPPRAYYQRLRVSLGDTLPVTLFACDPDLGSSYTGLTWAVTGGPVSGGQLSAQAGTYAGEPFQVTYTPAQVGTDSFFYQVNDGVTWGNTAEILITVLPVLSSVSISGSTDVPENSTVTYSLTANWTGQAPTDVTAAALWSENSPYAGFVPPPGTLVLSDVPSDQQVTVTGSYTFNGVSVADTLTLTVRNTSAAGGTLYVDAATQAPPASQDGLTWLTAFDHPSKAMPLATVGTPVLVASGTYTPLSTVDPAAPLLTLRDGVEVYGGYQVSGGVALSRDPSAYPSILDADADGDLSGDLYHLVAGASGAVLDGLVIRHGNASGVGSSADVAAGGMANVNVLNVTVRNCVFASNYASLYGGAMANYFSSVTIDNCTFRNNAGGNTGGAIDTDLNSTLLITNSVFSSNISSVNAGALGAYGSPVITVIGTDFTDNRTGDYGGAMDINFNGSVVVQNCTFTGGAAGLSGGGIYAEQNASLLITNTTFTGNSASEGGGLASSLAGSLTVSGSIFTGNSAIGDGGGVYAISDSTVFIDSTSFTANSAGSLGAGLFLAPLSTSTVRDSQFVGNVNSGAAGGGIYVTSPSSVLMDRIRVHGNVAYDGGGIFVDSPGATLVNSVVTSNRAGTANGLGGGLLHWSTGSLQVVHSSFSGNVASQGGGLYNLSPVNTTVVNSILWGDSAATDPEISGASTVSFSDVQAAAGPWPGTGNILADPAFANSLLALSAGSAAIDMGTDAGVATDYAGNARPQGAWYDMGAWEFGIATWLRTYSMATWVQARDIGPAPGGGFYLAGTSGWNFWVARLDASGALQWTRTFGDGNTDAAFGMDSTSDGGAVVTGQTFSLGAFTSDMWVVKLDSAGNIQWQKSAGTADQEYSYDVKEALTSTLQPDGYVVAGYRGSPATATPDFVVLRLNADGTQRWVRRYDAGERDLGFTVDQTADTGFIVSGLSRSFAGTGDYDAWLLKLNADGTVAWQRSVGTAAPAFQERVRKVRSTSDGGYIVAGQTMEFDVNGDFWVLKLDQNGDIAWQKSFGGTGADEAFLAQQTTDGGYLVVGSTDSFSSAYDAWIIKLAGDGSVVWQKVYDAGGDDHAEAAQLTLDFGYIVSGYTDSFLGSGNYEAWTIKMDANGQVGGFCDFGTSPVYSTNNTSAVSAVTTGTSAALALTAADTAAAFSTAAGGSTTICGSP